MPSNHLILCCNLQCFPASGSFPMRQFFTLGSQSIGEGNGNPLQYSCLENPMDRGAWWAAVHWVARSRTWLSDFTIFSLSCTGEGNGNLLQCSCLENPRDGGAWWAAIYGVAQNRTRLTWLSSSSSSQNIGVSASASVLPMNIQDWFPLGWTGWISLQSKGLSRVFSNTTVQKNQFLGTQLFIVKLSHPYMTTGKVIALTRWTFVNKVISVFIMLLYTYMYIKFTLTL